MEIIKKEPLFADANITEEEIRLFQTINELIIKKELIESGSRSSKVWEYRDPQELKAQLKLDIGRKPISHEELVEHFKTVLEFSTHTGHPRFMNQQYAARDLYGLLGTFITEAINPNCHTYEVAPAFVLFEMHMVKKLGEYVGFPEGEFDGLFTPGASLAIMHAMHLSRYWWNQKTKVQGLYGSPRLAVFTSEDCHYCVMKGASFLGLGLQSVYQVNTDKRGKMDVLDLEKQIQISKSKGEVPIFVNATCGTTVLGAFDPLESISDICKEHGIWLHADGAWGGSVMVSDKHRHLVKGIQRADSVTWNSHKMLGAPLQCSTLLVRHKGLLEDCFGMEASYIFQTDKFYDKSYDIGTKLLQCGRKAEGLKLWTMWKARGDEGIANIVDKAMDNAEFLTEKLKTRPGFKLVLPQYEFTNISFWYIPKRLREEPESKEWWAQIHQVAPKIKERMVKKGSLMLGYQPLESKNYVNFFRVIVENPACTHDDMEFIIDEIDRLGHDL